MAALAHSPDRPLPPIPKDVVYVAQTCVVLVRTFVELGEPIASILREAVPDIRHVRRKAEAGSTLDQWMTVEAVLKQAGEDVASLVQTSAPAV